MNEEVLIQAVVDTTSFCSTFPQIEGVEVGRENLVDVLETMLRGKAPSVHLAGDPGIGKTTLLSQFARRHSRNCVSVFARRSSWFTYDPDFLLRDLCGQMYWLLNHAELPSEQDVTDAMMRRLVYSLKSYSSRLNIPIVLVVDGLEEIPEQQSVLRDLMISKLPLGFDHIKVLTSSGTAIFPDPIRSRGKVWDVPGFGIEDTRTYFGNKVSAENIRKLHEVCKGRPGYLAGINRLFDAGQSEDNVLINLPATIPELFEMEWRNIDPHDAELSELLALLAHDANKHTIADLSILFNTPPDDLRRKLSAVTFIRVPASDNEEVLFVSELTRQFASKRLEKYRETVNRRVVDSLLRDQDSGNALDLLPAYLRQTGEYQKLLNFLSPERFARMLLSAHKLGPVQQKVKLGFETALEIKSQADALRFGIQSSAFVEYSGLTISRAEIEARMNLGQGIASLALAQSAVLKSDRLQLLTLVARKRKERGEIISEDLIDSIVELFGDVDWAEISRHAGTELAGDLLYVRPDLATQALERASGPSEDRRSYVDMAIAGISLASLAKQGGSVDVEATEIRASISDPQVFSISSALAQLIRVGGSSEFLEEVKKVELIKDRLFLIRQWAVHNRDARSAFQMLQYALDLGIRTTELTVDARHMRELAQALSLVGDVGQAQSLIRTFDTQKATIFRLGPSLDYVHLQLLLAATESRYDKASASQRLVDTYLSTFDLTDLSVATTCLALIIDNLTLIDPDGSIRAKEGIEELATAEFDSSLSRLLMATADHEVTSRDIIAALVRRSANRAIDVALMLNTEQRRDRGLEGLLSRLLDAPIEEIDFSVVPRLIGLFADPDLAEKATVDVLERLSRVKTRSKLLPHRSLLVELCSRIQMFSDSSLRIKGAAAGIACIRHSEIQEIAGLIQKLRKNLESAWEDLEDDANKLELTFSVAVQLASVEKEQAERYVSLADDFRSKVSVGGAFSSSRHCLQLAIRVYAGMLLRKVDADDDLKELMSRIVGLPSKMDRAALLTEIALKLIRYEKESDARKVINQHLKPLIDSLPANTIRRYQVTCLAAPALFVVAQPSAMELMRQLPRLWRQMAVAHTIEFIKTKQPYWEPNDNDRDFVYELTDDEISEIYGLMPELSVDSSFCAVVQTISRTVRSKYGKRTFTQSQSAAIAQKLTELINKHLPMPAYIQHDGYKLIALAEVQRILRPNRSAWTQIVAQARLISNSADRSLVLAILAKIGHSEGYDGAIDLLKEARACADLCGSLLDKMNRYHIIADECRTIDKEFSKQLLKEALLASSLSTEPEVDKERKAIVDAAYKIDPELASEFASALDDDRARRAKRSVSRQVELLNLKKRLVEGSDGNDKVGTSSLGLLPRASWDLLGSLNSGRVLPCDDDRIRHFLKEASELPFQRSFPVFSYALENLVAKHKDQSEAARVLRNAFRGVLTAADLFVALAERSSSDIPQIRQPETSLPDDGITVEPGDREKGIDYIRAWLSASLKEFLWINDPYLGPDQLVEILKLVLESRLDVELYLVTSRSGLDNDRVTKPYSDEFRNAWQKASIQEGPRTRVIVASVEPGGKAPIKDRWWVSRERGISMGTSFSGLGERTSRIELLSPSTFSVVFNRLSSVTTMRQREHDGDRISYESFDL